MVISVASGKGGTGKTTIAASLAYSLVNSVYYDCDVEEPNGHLLLSPEIAGTELVYRKIPAIDYSKCTFCNKCSDVCNFNALINLGSEILVFEQMCHSCGACSYFCPEKAITEKDKYIGTVGYGKAGNVEFYNGTLNIGEVSAVPLISALKNRVDKSKTTVIDSPPGTSCSMVETVKNTDYCILVTESTPFGLNDLKLAIDVLQKIGISFGVVINKYISDYTDLEEYLDDIGVNVLLRIELDRKIAENYSKGKLPVADNLQLQERFVAMYNYIEQLQGVAHEQ